MLDNVANLLLVVGLLSGAFGFPTKFAVEHMIPGTAIGVFVGDILFFFLALRLAAKTGRDVTAMPLGLDTPSTFGFALFVIGPAFLAALKRHEGDSDAAAMEAWRISVCAMMVSGVLKLVCAFLSNWIRRVVPRAGLLGSLAAIALAVISFVPFVDALAVPIVGLVSLSIILTSLVARVPLPYKMPGAVAGFLVSGALYHAMRFGGLIPAIESPGFEPHEAMFPKGWLDTFRFDWVNAFSESLRYLPVVIPFALATVIGGIDCTESAAAVGDEYDTGMVVGVEAIATLAAGLCGGVVQTTPYIGHPAYRAMGGRAAYVAATAIFIGLAGTLGFFGYLYWLVPRPVAYPILVFVGLEISAQSFLATPRRHYPAVALACVPALATLVTIELGKFVPNESAIPPSLQGEFLNLRMLSSGFVLTSLFLASALAAMTDHRLKVAAVWLFVAGLCASFGLIHSPLPGSPMHLPWLLEAPMRNTVLSYVAGYWLSAVLLWFWGYAVEPILNAALDQESSTGH